MPVTTVPALHMDNSGPFTGLYALANPCLWPLCRPRTLSIPASTGLYTWGNPVPVALVQALYTDNSGLYVPLYRDNPMSVAIVQALYK